MKKIFLLLVFLLIPSLCLAVGSWTTTAVDDGRIRQITAAYTADASNGSIPALTLPVFNGFLMVVRVGTGSIRSPSSWVTSAAPPLWR